MLSSMVCRYEHFLTDWYEHWSSRLTLEHYGQDASPRPQRPHRKAWEWCAMAQALEERDMLREGRSGCGFAVGIEPLASAFAKKGVAILATDQALTTQSADDWAATNQHAASLDACFRPEIVDRAAFDKLVRFQAADMNHLNLPWRETFDFVWSSCSLEHLGSLEAGLRFVENAMALLKPGGVAVHTTEFNVISNDATIEEGGSVIYRRRDIEALDYQLRRIGCGLARCDFYAGDHPFDLLYDIAPYGSPRRQHIKLELGGHIATSCLLIVQKSCDLT